MLNSKYINNQINPIDVSKYLENWVLGYFKTGSRYFSKIKIQLNNENNIYEFKRTKLLIADISDKKNNPFKYIILTNNEEFKKIGFFPYKELYINVYNWYYYYGNACEANRDKTKYWFKDC